MREKVFKGKRYGMAMLLLLLVLYGAATAGPVSYTHLDVYKRQNLACMKMHRIFVHQYSW